MTSVQAELSSARVCDELHNPSTSQDTDLSAVAASALFEEMSARIGGRFSADIAAILRMPSKEAGNRKVAPNSDGASDVFAYRQFALNCLRAGRVQIAVTIIERHAPEQMAWLEGHTKSIQAQPQVNAVSLAAPKVSEILATLAIVPDSVKVDAEVGRIAYVLGQFSVFRAWAYGLAADNGDGWMERAELETLWEHVGIATSSRHARRLIQNGVAQGYWSQDRTRKRIYLTGQVKVAAQLVRKAVATGKEEMVGTNLPGRRRVAVNLVGSLQEASARLYAAWFISKDTRCNGTMISRETLCRLWGVSVPTLLTWENIAKIVSQGNYAQSNDTAIDHVPQHAYLTLNRNGSYTAAWRLPNTYTVGDRTIQQHSRTGKAKQVRRAVRNEIAQAEQRGCIGDTALLRSGKRYFVSDARSKVTPFRACDNYLRKLGRSDGNLSLRHYFYIGERYGVRIFEAYNLHIGACETGIHQRLIWQESRDEFVTVKDSYHHAVRDCC